MSTDHAAAMELVNRLTYHFDGDTLSESSAAIGKTQRSEHVGRSSPMDNECLTALERLFVVQGIVPDAALAAKRQRLFVLSFILCQGAEQFSMVPTKIGRLQICSTCNCRLKIGTIQNQIKNTDVLLCSQCSSELLSFEQTHTHETQESRSKISLKRLTRLFYEKELSANNSVTCMVSTEVKIDRFQQQLSLAVDRDGDWECVYVASFNQENLEQVIEFAFERAEELADQRERVAAFRAGVTALPPGRVRFLS